MSVRSVTAVAVSSASVFKSRADYDVLGGGREVATQSVRTQLPERSGGEFHECPAGQY